MIWLYRVIYFLLKALALILRPVLSHSAKRWISLRSQPLQLAPEVQRPVWFHASSGEIEYCKSVIRLLKQQNPETSVVVTYSSASAEKLFHNIGSDVDQFIPLCWDTPAATRRLIQDLNPQALVFSRTDFWPELIWQAEQARIPLAAIAFNPQPGLLKNYLYRQLLSRFKLISCISAEAVSQMQPLLKNVVLQNHGDTRFDQVFYRLSQPSRVEILKTSSLLVLGSTWLEDENFWLPLIPGLVTENIQIILSPHDVKRDNIKRLGKMLDQMDINFSTLSSHRKAGLQPAGAVAGDQGPLLHKPGAVQISQMTSVLLVDEIGYLADFYRFADAAFVGGSFKEKVHSVMEPLCCGLHVLVGPEFQNNPEAVRYLGRFVHELDPDLANSEQLQMITDILNADRQKILNEMSLNKEASQRVITALQDKILKT